MQLLATIWCPFCLSKSIAGKELSSELSVNIRGDEIVCARGSSASEKLSSSSQGRAVATNGGGSPVPVEPVDQRVPVEVLKGGKDRTSLAGSSPCILCCSSFCDHVVLLV